jgi:hypothetical protein
MDYTAAAERHRHMAEQYRAMAGCETDESLRSNYRELAEMYDKLADKEDLAARRFRFSN